MTHASCFEFVVSSGIVPLVMQTLEMPDSHYLRAATGWLELGNSSEAKVELQRIQPDLTQHPDVLEVWWTVHASEHNWTSALDTARALIESAAERPSGWLHRAYALRRVPGSGLRAAWDALMPAFEKFPDEPIIPYNLSCYACQLDRLDEARKWLALAVKAGGKEQIKELALADPDLKPLWDEIRTA